MKNLAGPEEICGEDGISFSQAPQIFLICEDALNTTVPAIRNEYGSLYWYDYLGKYYLLSNIWLSSVLRIYKVNLLMLRSPNSYEAVEIAAKNRFAILSVLESLAEKAESGDLDVRNTLATGFFEDVEGILEPSARKILLSEMGLALSRLEKQFPIGD